MPAGPPTRPLSFAPLVAVAVCYASLGTVVAVGLQSPEYRTPALTVGGMLLVVAPLALLVATGLQRLAHRVEAITDVVTRSADEAGLSEQAKRVLHRRKDKEMLCTAIEQDLLDADWDAAMTLIKELAERFGYRAEAEVFRARVDTARAGADERHITLSLEQIDQRIELRRWAEAYAQADRLKRLHPESPQTDGLRDRVDAARSAYKAELERSFLKASQREDTDSAMSLLRELDPYLGPTEGDRLQEVARGVIGRARDNLGVSFKLMVQDGAWSEALRVGERIVEEFPNSLMAQEVRSTLSHLRTKAAGSVQ